MPAAPAAGAAGDFGGALNAALKSAMATGRNAEAQSMKAITQGGNVTEVATALSQAELTLQTATAVRDRMLQAYQDIMRIQI
jgi:flagellar hook-basal body complex protein FliE